MKALVGAFNQEKALVEAFSVIVKLYRWIVSQHYSSVSAYTLGIIWSWRAEGGGGGNYVFVVSELELSINLREISEFLVDFSLLK